MDMPSTEAIVEMTRLALRPPRSITFYSALPCKLPDKMAVVIGGKLITPYGSRHLCAQHAFAA